MSRSPRRRQRSTRPRRSAAETQRARCTRASKPQRSYPAFVADFPPGSGSRLPRAGAAAVAPAAARPARVKNSARSPAPAPRESSQTPMPAPGRAILGVSFPAEPPPPAARRVSSAVRKPPPAPAPQALRAKRAVTLTRLYATCERNLSAVLEEVVPQASPPQAWYKALGSSHRTGTSLKHLANSR